MPHIPGDEAVAQWREEFPITERYIYLNHAGVSPISRRVFDAVRWQAEDALYHGVAHGPVWWGRYEEVRDAAAKLFHASPRNIAFVKNTSEGLSFAAAGFPWREGDEIVTPAMEFSSNRFPWLALRDLGVRTVLVEDENGCVPAEKLIDACTPRTRLLAVSAVQFASGYRADLHALGAACRDRDVFFVVDGIQALGALRLYPNEVGADLVPADAHKWMLGPEGVGVAYLSDKAIDTLRVTEVGWHSAADPLNFSAPDFEFHPDARRFEPGTMPGAFLFGLGAALDLINEVGLELIERRVLALSAYARELCEARDWPVLGSATPDERSGIVIARVPGDADEMLRRLKDRSIIAAARAGGIRFAPHYYNTTEEIERAIAATAELAA